MSDVEMVMAYLEVARSCSRLWLPQLYIPQQDMLDQTAVLNEKLAKAIQQSDPCGLIAHIHPHAVIKPMTIPPDK